MFILMSQSNKSEFFFNVFFIVITMMLLGIEKVNADDSSPAFFLKIAKNVPRIGRSSGAENFFLKASKNIPRIGKREESSILENGYTSSPYNNDNQFLKATKRRIGYPANTGTETWTWEHFPLAIEGPPELWRTLARYSDEKAFESSDDIDNEILHRDKRAEEEN
ncbi:uncharacterized protein LOC127279848 [Leptopilina boulardi]|uniref:uncharacterized protein LOC127279848 n=1 Tax=Leptopilina boulardi TaxID=63433 RepID=UPI0021F681B3|nr:uncharacterized protein LOC127279848 [Leptopilina boulardi]XP_051158435.1 uncharacterized protein LOC127279848 [Leptopilina boulardi]